MTEFMVVHNMIKDYIHINNQVSDRHIFYDQNTYKEISISLFGECNMKCEFCIGNQRHKVHCPHDFETTIAAAKKEIENTNKKDISIVLYGGELFHDGIKDKTFVQYKRLIDQLTQFTISVNKTISWTISTNLVHKKRERVLAFLESVNIDRLCSSFDFEQRFTNPKLLETFLDNIQWYDQQGIDLCFGFILMNANINSFCNNHKLIPIFDWLYSRYPIYYDYYHPTNRSAEIVDERTIGQFLIWLDNHYPNIETLQNLRNKKHKTCCPATFIIDGVATRCCNFPLVAKQYAIKKQCFSCQYKNVCSHPCIRIMSNSSDCFVKMYYEYLDAKNDIN